MEVPRRPVVTAETHMTDEHQPLFQRVRALLASLGGREYDVSAPDVPGALQQLSDIVDGLEDHVAGLARQLGEVQSQLDDLVEQRATWEELFDLAPTAYLVTDGDGRILRANQEAGKLLGTSPDRLADREIAAYVPPTDRSSFRAGLRRVGAGRSPGPHDVTVHRRGRQPMVVSVVVRSHHAADDEPVRLLWTLTDVTSAREAQVALQARVAATTDEVEALRELDRWKDVFLAAAAHDLRAPLASIAGAAKTLALPRLDADDRHRLLVGIRRHADSLDRLLTDLLDLDRFTRGKVAADREPTDMAALAHEVVESVDAAGHRVVVDASPVTASVDRLRVRQVMTNLVENALKHTPSGTTVDVSLRNRDVAVEVVVEDDGPGLPDAVRSDVFAPFVSHAAHPTDAGGTGLGLSLVELFVELHGGTVRAEDRPGGGARFVVSLPKL